ncbi:MAG TPA: hypothetical protein VLC49_11195 [Solirubrobacteraceae bacterium]|nr:hypothetical protein [Solirubrobacteraceae bacterium]
MAQRSRKRSRRRSSAATPRPRPATTPQPAQPSSRSEERNAAVRATLTPLAPGERPWSLKIAALIALLIGGGDLIAVIINGKFSVGNAHAGASGVILFSVLMLVCAVGMWQQRYWAVLGFQAILAFVILFFSLLLLRASNVLAVVAALIVIGGGGYLFYKLVRVLSRLNMPKPPSRA